MEVYSANHSETVDQLLAWPWRRFERFYDSFMRRKLAESLEDRKNAMIAALWANSNYDDDKGTRQQAIAEIEANYEEVLDQILDRDWERKKAKAEKEYEDNPFFQAARRGVAKLEGTDDPDAPVGNVVDLRRNIDQ